MSVDQTAPIDRVTAAMEGVTNAAPQQATQQDITQLGSILNGMAPQLQSYGIQDQVMQIFGEVSTANAATAAPAATMQRAVIDGRSQDDVHGIPLPASLQNELDVLAARGAAMPGGTPPSVLLGELSGTELDNNYILLDRDVSIDVPTGELTEDGEPILRRINPQAASSDQSVRAGRESVMVSLRDVKGHLYHGLERDADGNLTPESLATFNERLANITQHTTGTESGALAREFEYVGEGDERRAVDVDLRLSGVLYRDTEGGADTSGQGQGQGQPQQDPGATGEQAIPTGAATTRAGAATSTASDASMAPGNDLMSLFLGGTAGTGAMLGAWGDQNHFGLGGNVSAADMGVLAGGFAGLTSIAAAGDAVLPSVSVGPFMHLPMMSTAMVAGGVEGAARLAGLPGLELNARKVRELTFQIQQDENMIRTIQSSNMPIEYLIMVIMAHVYDSADKRMRLKLEEIMVAEQLEKRRELREAAGKATGGFLSGLVSWIPGVGSAVGGAISGGIDYAVSKANEVDSRLNGNIKSHTVLTQELQMLVQILKQMMELISNLSKNWHDMAMTPIRNLR
ncbi:MAG: hypothetical protein AAFP04_04095 [Myxococcota bacterium]